MSKDTADITAVTYVCPGDVRADADNVTGSPDAEPSISTQGNVAATGGVAGECTNTDRRVEITGRVAEDTPPPSAVLELPLPKKRSPALLKRAKVPVAVLLLPTVLLKRANAPFAVLLLLVVLPKSAPGANSCIFDSL